MIAARLFAAALLATPPLGLAFAHDHAHSQAGQPGGAAKQARVVDVTAADAEGRMIFTPDRLDVAKGETIRFNIRNAGALAHEFVIGTKAENAAHGAMMAAMPDMKHSDPNAVTIPAGQSAMLVWRFAKAGAFEFACLIPGHYASGMHGVVNVK